MQSKTKQNPEFDSLKDKHPCQKAPLHGQSWGSWLKFPFVPKDEA